MAIKAITSAASKISGAASAAVKNAVSKTSSTSSTSSTSKVTTNSSGVKVVQNSNGTTSKYTVEDHSKEHVDTSSGTSINPNVLQIKINNGQAVKNTITGVNTYDGSKVVYESYVVNNVSYTKDGNRVVEGGNSNQSGLIPGKDDIERNAKNGTTTVWYYQAPPPTEPTRVPTITPVYEPDPTPIYRPERPDRPSEPSYEPPPNPPMPEIFDVPTPTFSADLQRANRFIYFLGLDKLEVKSLTQEKTSIRILRDIEIGKCEWIELEVDDYIPERASIEYYIIDGDKEVPILPNGRTTMQNEKLFPSIGTLFTMSDSSPEIRKDGEIISAELDEIRNSRDGVYSITYKTEGNNKYEPTEDTVKIKVVLRLYNDESDIPFISDIKVRIHGGEGTLWQDNI